MPYWEWHGLSGMDERRKYLEGRLKKQPLSCGADAVAEASQRVSARQQPVNSSHRRVSSSENGSQKSAVTADLERKGKMNPNAGVFIPEFPPPGGVCASRPSAPAHVTAEGPLGKWLPAVAAAPGILSCSATFLAVVHYWE